MNITRATIDTDSTAVLAFDNGTHIPCDRFIVRLFSGVIRAVLESVECDVDDRLRTIIPVPGWEPEPFWDVVDMLHGLKTPSCLATPDAVVASLECMTYLGVGLHEKPLEAHLWNLIQHSDDVELVVGHAPRLLRNDALARGVVAALIRLCPMWQDFHIEVLCPMRVHVDSKVVTAVVAHACNFFPPNLVVHWGLETLEAMAPFGQLAIEDAMKLVSMHGVMYHPCETVGVLKKLAALGDGMLWNASIPPMLRNVASSLEKFDVLPDNMCHVHGTQIKFHDYPHTSVCLSLEAKLPPRTQLTPWLKVVFCQDGRYDISFKPKKIDEDSKRVTAMQVRVMCFDRVNGPRGACAECWHFFDVNPLHDANEAYTLAHATKAMGVTSGPSHMLRLRTARLLRFDFFYGVQNILDNPIDAKCSLFSKGIVQGIVQ